LGLLSLARLTRSIGEGERLLLDTSTLVAYFNDNETVSTVAQHIVDVFVHDGRNKAVVSTLTAAELFVVPLRNAPHGFPHVHAFLTRWPNLSLADVDLHVAQEAASVRAAHGLKMPDAIIVGTGLVTQVKHLITNDALWAKRLSVLRKRISVCELAKFAAVS
jgi:predicted nucleic acid-binding protein